jgi:hypothetical protein
VLEKGEEDPFAKPIAYKYDGIFFTLSYASRPPRILDGSCAAIPPFKTGWNARNLLSVVVALGSVRWVDMARIVRGSVLSIREEGYVLAARTIGPSPRRIITRHLLPNAMGPIVVTATMLIPQAIFIESFLSFIGLGVSAPMSSWGTLCNEAPITASASSEIFVCVGDQPSPDFGGARNPDGQGFAAFGRATSGMGVVRMIQALGDEGQYLVEPVAILRISRSITMRLTGQEP